MFHYSQLIIPHFKDILLANQKNELLEMKLLMLKTQKSGLLIKKS
jgi:hypothetical protein